VKIVHISDSHFQKKRLDECVKCFQYIIEKTKKIEPDFIFHAGDLFDKNTLINSSEYYAAVENMIELAEIAPVYIIRGNHDPVGSLDIFSELETYFSITVIDSIDVVEENGYALLTIPYINPSLIGSGENIGSIHVTGAESIREKINDFVKYKTDKLKFILAHISVMNSQFANSERIQEGEIILSVDDFDHEELNAVFLGHIHRSHQDIFKDKPIRYAGAHYRTRYDEILTPGFYVWEFAVRKPQIDFIEIPARNMFQVNLDEESTKKMLSKPEFDFPENCDVKLVLEIPQGMNKVVDKDKIRSLAPEGTAIDIVLKVNPVAEVRSEKMSKVRTDQEKLDEWGRVSGIKITSSIKKKLDVITNG
jgi:DNA repair exonuclease SbcCD nuclease subunit